MKIKGWRKEDGRSQWASRHHPDFLFIAIQGNTVVRRIGNSSFDLVGTKPEILYNGQSYKDAYGFVIKWLRKHECLKLGGGTK